MPSLPGRTALPPVKTLRTLAIGERPRADHTSGKALARTQPSPEGGWLGRH